MIKQYKNIKLGDEVEEWHLTGNGPKFYRKFTVTDIYRKRDMDNNIIIMIGDDEEAVNYDCIRKIENENKNTK